MVDGEEIWESNTRGGRGRRVGPLGVEEVVKRRRGIRIKITITIRNTIKSKIKSKSKIGGGNTTAPDSRGNRGGGVLRRGATRGRASLATQHGVAALAAMCW